MTRPTIYEYAGGAPAFLALATAHHARCLADPVLNHPFSHADQNPRHVRRLADYWAEVFGGPPAFPGDHTAVLTMHAHMGADDDLGDRFLACFVGAVDDCFPGSDPELRAALRAYMRWAVDDVMSYDDPDAVVPEGVPVPRWDWTGLIRRGSRPYPPGPTPAVPA
jgi:hemoglobin